MGRWLFRAFPGAFDGSPSGRVPAGTERPSGATGIFPAGGPGPRRLHGTLPEREPVNVKPNDSVSRAAWRKLVDRLAREVGFDLVAVTDAAEFVADRAIALRRIDEGMMDGLPWFTKSRVRRGTSPEELLPGARSIICLGLNYYPDSEDSETPGAGRVARYARGRDYHRLMKRRMRRLVIALSEHPLLQDADTNIGARWFVDDGPMLDRAAAGRAGLGWFGKNGNVLNPSFGSWLLLGQIITDLDLTPDAPLSKNCGQCTRCMPACPTDAIVAPYVVDNRRCISYLTIEHKGTIPRELREGMGNWVFGCDICQEVCPVNRKAKAADDSNFGRRDLSALDLIELLEMTEADFRRRFAGTPIMRAKWTGMQRNACVALGNVGDTSAVPALARAVSVSGGLPPLVRQHAAWALGRIGGPEARAALDSARETEQDESALCEIRQALAR
ncbi:MAG: tRNA epoxyqueuosine(34) reductase QueG [Chloroflexi bacterium]|nr:tRNA epoxyqueuosine(34) reductase QueG [Chloroflexota bacterium]MYD47426.1 tRNA epoxyqueuosine(34) reductase QueG [Chloroflexota bacterium]